MIEGQEGVSWPQWQALAAACEEHGVPGLFRSDHYLPLDGHHERAVLDAWGTICALAATTTTVRLGTLVSPATFRHPAILAKLAVTADHISGGRVEAGLGAGWHEGEHERYGIPFAATRERMDAFALQLDTLRRLWGPDAPFANPKPVHGTIPLIVGGAGKPRSVALAARYADEYNTPFATAGEARDRRAAVEAAWAEAGRDPATVRFSVMTGAVLGRTPDEVDARRRSIGARRDEPGFTPPRTWITGTVDEAAAQLTELAAAGCDRVMLQLLLHDDLDQVALIGGELAAAVAEA
jgi:alkanesulfonate monooxygenase SsuD/methylene tetrahydromethanopterin reductase-like flavin-dependent oxidoreductase (luciferase family)